MGQANTFNEIRHKIKSINLYEAEKCVNQIRDFESQTEECKIFQENTPPVYEYKDSGEIWMIKDYHFIHNEDQLNQTGDSYYRWDKFYSEHYPEYGRSYKDEINEFFIMPYIPGEHIKDKKKAIEAALYFKKLGFCHDDYILRDNFTNYGNVLFFDGKAYPIDPEEFLFKDKETSLDKAYYDACIKRVDEMALSHGYTVDN